MAEMEKNLIRLLKADEIECRVSVINEKGLSLLLYKDARVDQKILDETFGIFGWKRSHQCIEGNLYCTVEIRDDKTGEWIAKQDVGTTGYAEKEKSQASDSFKRACFNWGIGRELYTAPFIWIPADTAQIKKKGDKYYCNERFTVASIAYSDAREMTFLEVEDSNGKAVFIWKCRETAGKRKPVDSVQEERQKALEKELKRTGVRMEEVQKRYRIKDPASMSEEMYGRVMQALAKTKSAESAA